LAIAILEAQNYTFFNTFQKKILLLKQRNNPTNKNKSKNQAIKNNNPFRFQKD